MVITDCKSTCLNLPSAVVRCVQLRAQLHSVLPNYFLQRGKSCFFPHQFQPEWLVAVFMIQKHPSGQKESRKPWHFVYKNTKHEHVQSQKELKLVFSNGGRSTRNLFSKFPPFWSEFLFFWTMILWRLEAWRTSQLSHGISGQTKTCKT